MNGRIKGRHGTQWTCLTCIQMEMWRISMRTGEYNSQLPHITPGLYVTVHDNNSSIVSQQTAECVKLNYFYTKCNECSRRGKLTKEIFVLTSGVWQHVLRHGVSYKVGCTNAFSWENFTTSWRSNNWRWFWEHGKNDNHVTARSILLRLIIIT